MILEEKRFFCFGTGYLAKAIARVLLSNERPDKWVVFGSFRRESQAKELSDVGITPIEFNVAKDSLVNADAILSSIPPAEFGDPVLSAYGDLLSSICSNSWIGYFSTTGVYGDTKGMLVDETATLNPSNNRSQRRVVAEIDWLKYDAHIFRLPGIYGPNRSALDKLKKGITHRIHYPNHVSSRIHVDDIAQTIISSIEKPNPGSIYNVCDDEAAEQQMVEAYAAELLGIPPPPLIPFESASKHMSPTARTFWQDSRRISNKKIKNELVIKLLYPTFRQGLKLLHQNSKSFDETD